MAKEQPAPIHPQPEHTKTVHKFVRPIGGYILAKDPIEINVGRPRTKLTVRNTGDRPIQVGSHFHFFETNRYLEFDRPSSFGQRLDIPANTAVRFEPGDEKEVTLVPYAGKSFVYGFNNLVDGWTGDGPKPDYRPNREAAIERANKRGFKSRAAGKANAK
ncbi:urease subunit beta [Mesorhizobium sp. ANAO-SY3R2]|uniref:urease subunit beta n=1 Tax=Mesorhizobium sp. ANAO-SY3R2 TaxID=3166644 RepID=UPI0036734331